MNIGRTGDSLNSLPFTVTLQDPPGPPLKFNDVNRSRTDHPRLLSEAAKAPKTAVKEIKDSELFLY